MSSPYPTLHSAFGTGTVRVHISRVTALGTASSASVKLSEKY